MHSDVSLNPLPSGRQYSGMLDENHPGQATRGSTPRLRVEGKGRRHSFEVSTTRIFYGCATMSARLGHIFRPPENGWGSIANCIIFFMATSGAEVEYTRRQTRSKCNTADAELDALLTRMLSVSAARGQDFQFQRR